MKQPHKKASHSIDINADLGEGTSRIDCKNDEKLMPYISSCNIACGGHAGNEITMVTSLENAIKHQLKIGAHPGYDDKKNFGRVSITLSKSKLEKSLKQQIEQLNKLALKQNIHLHHIKFHGALYNDIESNEQLAIHLATFCKQHYPSLKLLGLANGNLQSACKKLNMAFIAEGFMDRSYLSNARLSSRMQTGSIITEQNLVIAQAINLSLNQPIKTIDQQEIVLKINSICLHGDNPNALNIAKNLHNIMKGLGIRII